MKEVENYLHSIIKEQSDKLNYIKEDAIQKRLAERGIEINWYHESIRRFKKLSREVQGNVETYYYDDGSIEGVKLISFEMGEWKQDMQLDILSVKSTINITTY